MVGSGDEGVHAEVSNLADLDMLYAHVREKLGRLDLLGGRRARGPDP